MAVADMVRRLVPWPRSPRGRMDLTWVPRSMGEELEPERLRSVGALGPALYARREAGSRMQGLEGTGSGLTLEPCRKRSVLPRN